LLRTFYRLRLVCRGRSGAEGDIMSDWFRWYDDALDEPRLQYAINKHPSVVAVWLWFLSQCAKKKRDTVDEICNATLLGISHKLGIGAGVVNECVSLLLDINYIEKCDGGYKVRKWNDLQSEYMRLKKYRDGKMIRTQYVHDNDMYVHDTSRGEERRGEEIRKEKSTLAPLADFDRLWSAYPSKTGSKEKAKKAWEKWRKDGDTVEVALAGIERYKKSVEHQRRNGFADLKYQNGQTFFNGRGWATEWSVDDKSAQSKAETSKSEQARNRLVAAYSEQILHCATHDEAVRFMEKVHDGLRDAVAEGWVWQEWEKKAEHND